MSFFNLNTKIYLTPSPSNDWNVLSTVVYITKDIEFILALNSSSSNNLFLGKQMSCLKHRKQKKCKYKMASPAKWKRLILTSCIHMMISLWIPVCDFFHRKSDPYVFSGYYSPWIAWAHLFQYFILIIWVAFIFLLFAFCPTGQKVDFPRFMCV